MKEHSSSKKSFYKPSYNSNNDIVHGLLPTIREMKPITMRGDNVGFHIFKKRNLETTVLFDIVA